MQSLGPFDPLAISAGLFTNLAYDILKHRLQSAHLLEGTLAGKMLKWAGIMEPNFKERLRETLSKTLSIYFKEHPQYALSGVADFFQDAAVEQIGDYILDRRPFDYVQLQTIFHQHFGTAHSASRILFQRRGLSSKQIINDFVLSYRRVLGEQLSIPQMGLLLDVLDQTTTTVNEIQASEQRLKDHIQSLLGTRLSSEALNAAYQVEQKQLVQDLVSEVRASLVSSPSQTATHYTTKPGTLAQSSTQTHPVLFTDGLCSGYLFQPAPYQYFISHGFGPDTLADWREAIIDAMSQADTEPTTLKPFFSGDLIMGGFRLCGICEKLYTARFSLFLLPAIENHNVYIELGIAIGLGAPFFLIQEREALLPPVLMGLSLYTQKGSLLTMRRELSGQVKEYNFGAVRFVKEQAKIPTSSQYLIGAGEQFDDEEFEWAITKSLEKIYPKHLAVISLSSETKSEEGAGFALKQLVETIQASRFSLYRVDEYCSATTFLALGISLGLSRPFLMLHKTDKIPLDIRGMSTCKFSSFTGLSKDLTIRYRRFFDRYMN